MMKLLCLLLILSFMSGCVTMEEKAQDDQRSSALYKLGVAYLNENKIQQAFVEFQKAYDLNPNDKEVLNAIGIIYLLHFDEPAKAIGYFERATKSDKDYSEAYNNLGVAYEKAGQYETAISFYKQAVSNVLYQTPERAYINMGNSYYRLGKYDLAVSSLKEALKRAPGSYLAYLKLALCYNSLGRYGDASSAMAQAIQRDPSYKGNREAAIEDLTLRMSRTEGPEAKDFGDYLEILKY